MPAKAADYFPAAPAPQDPAFPQRCVRLFYGSQERNGMSGDDFIRIAKVEVFSDIFQKG